MKNLALTLFTLCSITLNAIELQPCNGQERSKIEVIKFVAPSYPTDTYFDGNGKVTIQLYVDRNGSLIDHAIKSSSPARLFDRSALKALGESLFSKSNKDEVRCGIMSYDFFLE